MTGAAALALLLALAGPVAARGDAAPGAQRLEELRREIEAREAAASDYARQATGYLGELDGIDRELTETRRSARRLRRELRAAEGERGTARAELAEADQALQRTRRDLEVRLVALYKFGQATGVSTLYSAADFRDFLGRRSALTRILGEDTRVFESHRLALAERLESRQSLDAVIARLEVARRELSVREERIRTQLVERTNLVALLRSRSDRELRAATELREAAARLEKALADLTAAGGALPGTGLVKGRLPFPVEGAVRYGFGRTVDPEFGTQVLRNGIQFEARRGSPVRAVGDGRVLFAGWFRGYGQIVILDHGARSVTVSGYLDELSVQAGDDVSRGDPVGTVGDTGSLSGPGLYFELRHEGKPVDPRAWLNATN